MDIVVIGDGEIFTRAGSRPYDTTNILHVTGLAGIALHDGFRAVWIKPGSDVERKAENPSFWRPGPIFGKPEHWNIFTTGANNETPSYASIRAVGQHDEVSVYGDVANRWYCDSSNAEDVLRHIIRYEHVLGTETRQTPAQTALELLRRTCATPARTGWLEPLSDDIYRSIPWPHERGLSHTNPDPRDGQYIHVYDKRFAFGAACLHEFGSGDPMLLTSNISSDDILRGKVYGLFCISATPPKTAIDYLPSPWAASEPTPEQDYYYTPQLVLAHQMGWEITIHDGYVWSKKHQLLRDWAQTIYHARNRPGIQGTSIETLIKASFNQARGVMRPSNDYKLQWYHRPDWNNTIAAVHYLRQMLSIQTNERAFPGYLAVKVDSIAWISDDPNPDTAIKLNRDPAMLGSYKHVCTYAGRDAQHIIQAARDGEKAYKVMEGIDDAVLSDVASE